MSARSQMGERTRGARLMLGAGWLASTLVLVCESRASAQAEQSEWRALGATERAEDAEGFGAAIALENQRAIVDTTTRRSSAERVVVALGYRGTTWVSESRIDDVAHDGAWANAVALSGAVGLLGARFDGSGEVAVLAAGDDGVFTRSDSLRVPYEPGELFGICVALDADAQTAVVGSVCDLAACTKPDAFAGGAYVFELRAGSWTQSDLLQVASHVPSDRFGAVVQLSHDTLAVAAPDTAEGGVVHVFERSAGSGFVATQVLSVEPPLYGADFGGAMALRDDRLVIGAPGQAEGVVYVYKRGAAGFELEAQLSAPELGAGARFGQALALDAQRVVVGARGADGETGAVIVYRADSSAGFSEEARPRPQTLTDGAGYGTAVAIDGDQLLVGAPLDDGVNPGERDIGAVYAFRHGLVDGAACGTHLECAARVCTHGVCGGTDVGRFGTAWDAGLVDPELARARMHAAASAGCAVFGPSGSRRGGALWLGLLALRFTRRRRS